MWGIISSKLVRAKGSQLIPSYPELAKVADDDSQEGRISPGNNNNDDSQEGRILPSDNNNNDDSLPP